MRSTRFAIRGLTMSLTFSLVSGITVAVGACRESARVGHARPDLRADVAIAWNALVLEVAEAEDRFLTLKGVRTAAMMHLAMHDALNAIDPRYEAYLPGDTGTVAVTPVRARGADAEAAAAQAAFVVAVDQYPDRRGRFETELARSLEEVDDAPARTRGLEIGRAAAERILAAREGDGWDRGPTTSGIRWLQGCTPSFRSTAVRHRDSSLGPAGRRRVPSRWRHPISSSPPRPPP